MLVKTPAIVLNAIKYGDSGKIVKFFTLNQGLVSCISKSIYSKKNRTNSLLFSFNFVELVYDEKPNQSLHFLKEMNASKHFNSIHQQPEKITIILFLTEILNSVLKEEEPNRALFEFLEKSIFEFDQKNSGYSDFHLWFLLNLTQFLGFYPHFEKGFIYFDLNNGVSSEEIPTESYISDLDLQNFEKLISLDFQNQMQPQFNQIQRKSILLTLLKYYELHISDFRQPKSLEVLNQVFQ